MRSIVAVLGALTTLLLGVAAISIQAQQVDPAAGSTANETYTTALDVFGGVLSTGGQGIVWFGVTAVVLLALGLLAGYASGGGR